MNTVSPSMNESPPSMNTVSPSMNESTLLMNAASPSMNGSLPFTYAGLPFIYASLPFMNASSPFMDFASVIASKTVIFSHFPPSSRKTLENPCFPPSRHSPAFTRRRTGSRQSRPHHEAQVAGRCHAAHRLPQAKRACLTTKLRLLAVATATLRAACRFDRLKARSLPRGGRRCH